MRKNLNGELVEAIAMVNPQGVVVSPYGDYSIRTRGNTIATAAAAASAAIPNTATGVAPKRIRLACTAACYTRLGVTSEISAVVAAAGTAYVPGDTITLAGGTFATAMTLTVATTKVVSATVNAGGTGDLGNGAGVIVEGTTGTGTKFRASVTIATFAIASVQSITIAGAYSANPTAIGQEPVTYISGAASGTTLTGAKLAVIMGVDTVNVSDAGSYTALPTNPVAQGASSDGGINATFTVTFATAAAAGDLLVTPEQSVVLDAAGFENVSAIRVTADGVLQISPIEN